MKIISKVLDINNNGKVTLIPQSEEDMWVLYNNIIKKGDEVQMSICKKLKVENSERIKDKKPVVKIVRVCLTLKIENIDYDSRNQVIFVKGKNVKENKYVYVGCYHSFSIELNNEFCLWKKMGENY